MSNPVRSKVKAVGVAGVVSAAPLAVILPWLLRFFKVDMPAEVAIAVASLLTTLINYAAGWLKIEKVSDAGSQVGSDSRSTDY